MSNDTLKYSINVEVTKHTKDNGKTGYAVEMYQRLSRGEQRQEDVDLEGFEAPSEVFMRIWDFAQAKFSNDDSDLKKVMMKEALEQIAYGMAGEKEPEEEAEAEAEASNLAFFPSTGKVDG